MTPLVFLSCVSGNAQWLFCKSRVCGVSSVIWDLDQCSQYMNCTETQLVRDTLVLIKPSLDFLDGEMGWLYFLGRLKAPLKPKHLLSFCFSSDLRLVSVLRRAAGQAVLFGQTLPLCDWPAVQLV